MSKIKEFIFEDIAINSKEKKKPEPNDFPFYLGLENLDSENLQVTRFNTDAKPSGEKLVMHKGDILFGKRRAYQKKVAIAPFDGIFSAHGMVLRPNTKVIDSNFFPFFISSSYFLDRAIAISVGSLSPTINWGDLRTQKFYLPSIEEQRKAANLLWKIDSLEHKYSQAVSACDEAIKANFIEMFINNKYKEYSLNDVSIEKGEYGAASASVKYDEKRPRYIRITDIQEDGTLNNDLVCSINIDDDKDYKLSDGDFLFARMGATVGKTFYYTSGDFIFAGYLIRYKLDTNKILPSYLYTYTKLDKYLDWVKINKSGAAQPGINAKKYGSLKIPVAPIDLQNQFNNFFDKIRKIKLSFKKSIDSLKLIKSAIIDDIFAITK